MNIFPLINSQDSEDVNMVKNPKAKPYSETSKCTYHIVLYHVKTSFDFHTSLKSNN